MIGNGLEIKGKSLQLANARYQWRTQDFLMGGSVTSHRDDVKIPQLTYSGSEVLKCIGL